VGIQRRIQRSAVGETLTFNIDKRFFDRHRYRRRYSAVIQ